MVSSPEFTLASFYPPYLHPPSLQLSYLHPSSPALHFTHLTSSQTVGIFTWFHPRFILPTLPPPQLFVSSPEFTLASFYPPYLHPNSLHLDRSSPSLHSIHPTSNQTVGIFAWVHPRFILPTLPLAQLLVSSPEFTLASFYAPYLQPNFWYLHLSSPSLHSTHPTSSPTVGIFTWLQPRFILPTLPPPQLFISSPGFTLTLFYPPYLHPNCSYLHLSSPSLHSTHPTSTPTVRIFAWVHLRFIVPTLASPQLLVSSPEFIFTSFYPPYLHPDCS